MGRSHALHLPEVWLSHPPATLWELSRGTDGWHRDASPVRGAGEHRMVPRSLSQMNVVLKICWSIRSMRNWCWAIGSPIWWNESKQGADHENVRWDVIVARSSSTQRIRLFLIAHAQCIASDGTFALKTACGWPKQAHGAALQLFVAGVLLFTLPHQMDVNIWHCVYHVVYMYINAIWERRIISPIKVWSVMSRGVQQLNHTPSVVNLLSSIPLQPFHRLGRTTGLGFGTPQLWHLRNASGTAPGDHGTSWFSADLFSCLPHGTSWIQWLSEVQNFHLNFGRGYNLRYHWRVWELQTSMGIF